jgi:hypothetical protein
VGQFEIQPYGTQPQRSALWRQAQKESKEKASQKENGVQA